MTKELIQKLEKVKVPEIRMPNRQRQLKGALLISSHFEKPKFTVFLRRFLVLGAPVLAALAILITLVIEPRLTEAKVLRIAKNNPEIQRLMEGNNMILNQVKIQDGKAYVLLNPQEEVKEINEKTPSIIIQKTEKHPLEDIEGAVVEVNLKQKEVVKINSIKGEDIIPLKDTEKETVRRIINEEEIIRQIIPKDAKIKKIESSLPQKIDLVEKNREIKVIHESEKDGKKAHIHYVLDGKEWMIEVNLDKEKVEKIKYSFEGQPDDEDSKDENNQNEKTKINN